MLLSEPAGQFGFDTAAKAVGATKAWHKIGRRHAVLKAHAFACDDKNKPQALLIGTRNTGEQKLARAFACHAMQIYHQIR